MQIIKTYDDGSRKIRFEDGLEVSVNERNVVGWSNDWASLWRDDRFTRRFFPGHGDPHAQYETYTLRFAR